MDKKTIKPLIRRQDIASRVETNGKRPFQMGIIHTSVLNFSSPGRARYWCPS
jgi:hypothetical protein